MLHKKKVYVNSNNCLHKIAFIFYFFIYLFYLFVYCSQFIFLFFVSFSFMSPFWNMLLFFTLIFTSFENSGFVKRVFFFVFLRYFLRSLFLSNRDLATTSAWKTRGRHLITSSTSTTPLVWHAPIFSETLQYLWHSKNWRS